MHLQKQVSYDTMFLSFPFKVSLSIKIKSQIVNLKQKRVNTHLSCCPHCQNITMSENLPRKVLWETDSCKSVNSLGGAPRSARQFLTPISIPLQDAEVTWRSPGGTSECFRGPRRPIFQEVLVFQQMISVDQSEVLAARVVGLQVDLFGFFLLIGQGYISKVDIFLTRWILVCYSTQQLLISILEEERLSRCISQRAPHFWKSQ